VALRDAAALAHESGRRRGGSAGGLLLRRVGHLADRGAGARPDSRGIDSMGGAVAADRAGGSVQQEIQDSLTVPEGGRDGSRVIVGREPISREEAARPPDPPRRPGPGAGQVERPRRPSACDARGRRPRRGPAPTPALGRLERAAGGTENLLPFHSRRGGARAPLSRDQRRPAAAPSGSTARRLSDRGPRCAPRPHARRPDRFHRSAGDPARGSRRSP